MPNKNGSIISSLSAFLFHSTAESAVLFIFLLLSFVPSSLQAQGLAPSAPTKEFIYFNGRLVAVEQRGSGPAPNIVVAPHPITAAATTPAAGTPSSAGGAAGSVTLPVPGVSPQGSGSSPAPLIVVTPAVTHTATPPSPQ